MASLLQGALKQQIYKGFKGKLCVGKLRRESPAATDSFGDSDAPATVDYRFEGIRQSFNAAFAATAGIPETDVQILVLLGSIAVVPKQDDLLFVGAPFNKWHKARRVMSIDPAGAAATIQAYEIEDPS